MDFVHDTLWRPDRILTVVDQWSHSSPVLEAGFRMSGEIVCRVLDRVLSDKSGPCSITVDHGTEFQSRALKTGPIGGASSSTSFDRGNPGKCLH
jgi:putative transposase